MTLAVELQFLYEEFLEEDLFSDGVDVRQVAAVLAALILSAVERHRFVDDDVLGAVETSTTVPHPAVLVCSVSPSCQSLSPFVLHLNNVS